MSLEVCVKKNAVVTLKRHMIMHSRNSRFCPREREAFNVESVRMISRLAISRVIEFLRDECVLWPRYINVYLKELASERGPSHSAVHICQVTPPPVMNGKLHLTSSIDVHGGFLWESLQVLCNK